MSADLLQPYVSEGDGVIDLGANDGSAFTRAFLRMVGPSGHVLAVEPDLTQVQVIADKWGTHAALEIAPVVVGGSGSGHLCIDDGDRRRNSLWETNTLRCGGRIDVQMVTLDYLAHRVRRLKAIKMDVQGAECHVLDGAQETLARDLVWFVELWPQGLKNAGRSVDELAAQFQAHGYQIVGRKDGWNWGQVLDVIRGYDGHKSCDVLLKKPTSPDRN